MFSRTGLGIAVIVVLFLLSFGLFKFQEQNRTQKFIVDQKGYWSSHLDPLVKQRISVSMLKEIASKENWTFANHSEYLPGKVDRNIIMLTNGNTSGGKVFYSDVVAFVKYGIDNRIVSYQTDLRAFGP